MAPTPSTAEKGYHRTVNQLARLVEISLNLNSTMDPEQLLQSIIRTAAELLDCEAVSILLYEESSKQLRFAAATGGDPLKLSRIPVPDKGSIAGTIFHENKTVIVDDVQTDPRHYERVGQQVNFEPVTLLGVPMRIQSRVMGVLEALNKHSGKFTQEDASILAVIASQAAVAIQNARQMHALETAYSEIRRADEVKSRFLALASHELRTPLQHVLGYASILASSTDEDTAETARRILSSSNRMRAIIESMTHLDLMRKGELAMEFTLLAVQAVMQIALEEYQSNAATRNIQIDWLLPEDPLIVKANPDKLRVVFASILDNAIRFTPDTGSISINGWEEGKKIRLEIRDSGIGIPPDELENVFKEFYQLEDPLTRSFGGLGLGLTVARGIVLLHGGRIWAESLGTNNGTTIIIELPAGNVPGTGGLPVIVNPV